jgi:hypothetical protein
MARRDNYAGLLGRKLKTGGCRNLPDIHSTPLRSLSAGVQEKLA